MTVKLHSIPVVDIQISPNRQRREFNTDKLIELANSISENGLIHPIVVRKENGETLLVAGERRLRSLDYVWNFGGTLRCGAQAFAEGQAPCLFLGEIDPIDAFEIELEENIRREDLSWQDRARSTSELLELRRLQAAKRGAPEPTTLDIAKEVIGDDRSLPHAQLKVKRDLILARNLDNEEVSKAKTADEGFKILIRQETKRRNAELSAAVGKSFSQSSHRLEHADFRTIELRPEFDVILTDPPYGIDAQNFADSGGKAQTHFYDDSLPTWRALMSDFALYSIRVTKPEAHLYCFCDIDNFVELRTIMSGAGWTVFRTPLIWHNPGGIRAPWPDNGPMRTYQLCLYAMRGKKRVNSLISDVISCGSDTNLGHQAQKPVELYVNLLKRSTKPGDAVLDPFCGSGTIFPAAHSLTLYATGIEQDQAACGIAAQRIKDLA